MSVMYVSLYVCMGGWMDGLIIEFDCDCVCVYNDDHVVVVCMTMYLCMYVCLYVCMYVCMMLYDDL